MAGSSLAGAAFASRQTVTALQRSATLCIALVPPASRNVPTKSRSAQEQHLIITSKYGPAVCPDACRPGPPVGLPILLCSHVPRRWRGHQNRADIACEPLFRRYPSVSKKDQGNQVRPVSTIHPPGGSQIALLLRPKASVRLPPPSRLPVTQPCTRRCIDA